MNKDQAKGGMKDIAGKAQEKFGQATDNRSQQAKGMAKLVLKRGLEVGRLPDQLRRHDHDPAPTIKTTVNRAAACPGRT